MHRAKMQVFEGSFVTAIGNMSVFLTFIVNLMNNLIAFVQWAVMFQRILEEPVIDLYMYISCQQPCLGAIHYEMSLIVK